MRRRFASERAAKRFRIARATVGLGLLLALSGLWSYLWVARPFVF